MSETLPTLEQVAGNILETIRILNKFGKWNLERVENIESWSASKIIGYAAENLDDDFWNSLPELIGDEQAGPITRSDLQESFFESLKEADDIDNRG